MTWIVTASRNDKSSAYLMQTRSLVRLTAGSGCSEAAALSAWNRCCLVFCPTLSLAFVLFFLYHALRPWKKYIIQPSLTGFVSV